MPTFAEIQQKFFSLFDESDDWWQWGIIVGCFLAAYLTRFIIKRTFEKTESRLEEFWKGFSETRKEIKSAPVFFCIYLWIVHGTRSNIGDLPCQYIHSTALLVTAYCIYQLASTFSRGKAMPKLLGGGMLAIFALHQLGWLEPLRQVLTGISIPLGDVQIDVWKIASAIAMLFLLLWLVSLTNKLIDNSVKSRKEIPPSIRVLIGKASRLVLYVSAFLIALSIAGVPLGGLAIFSGALGLGIGFGLQKVISNLISGVIILLDKSIKPGDVIEINGTYGWINTLRTRYVSVLTRDRKEILIPNEDFITNSVTNWSFSDTNVRIRADLGVSYDTDIEKAIELCVEAASSIERVLEAPAPRCLLVGFGDSSINLQIRFWINDANEGVANVRSQVLLEIWKTFRRNNIEIPFPQREIHIKQAPEKSNIILEE